MKRSDDARENAARREIARRIVALFKEYAGRGPTIARTYFGQDLVLVSLADTLTRAERTLAQEARLQLVREMRRTLQGAMREEVREIVEQETGRRVAASLSDHSVLPDYAIEAFVLEPLSEDAEDQGLPALSRPETTNGHREISRGMVALFKDHTGRGPTHGRTYLSDDLVAVLFADTLTRAEKTLAGDDRTEMVRDIRRHFQGTIRDAAVALVEERFGSGVVKAFLSDNSIYPDYAIEVFLLESESQSPERT